MRSLMSALISRESLLREESQAESENERSPMAVAEPPLLRLPTSYRGRARYVPAGGDGSRAAILIQRQPSRKHLVIFVIYFSVPGLA